MLHLRENSNWKKPVCPPPPPSASVTKTIQTGTYIVREKGKKMFNLDDKKIACALGNQKFCFGRARKPRMLGFYFWRR